MRLFRVAIMTSCVSKKLLADGASLEARDDHGLTPLHGAVLQKYDDMVQLLVAEGADKNALWVLTG